MSLVVKVGKKGKQLLKKFIAPTEKHSLSYTRRIERIKTTRRVCAMTFDDGPMDIPASPDRFDGKSLTDILLDTLAAFDAKGTFDIVGDTGENYPDKAGKLGSAAWGGVKYDHYPDIHCDNKGGAKNNDRLIRRILGEGHQITNHGYRHILFGKKPFVYGAREYLGSLEKVLEDLKYLDDFMREHYGYVIEMSRPAHYVDRMQDGFTSYDAYDLMGYQYMAASFDGAGWLPSVHADHDTALSAEINAMVEPMRRALEQDPDFFCGQVIFQKDGYNMAKRTPVAFGLRMQLELLHSYGYKVVTMSALCEESPFADLGRDDPMFEVMLMLSREHAVVYSDNRLRLDARMTVGELAMLLAPRTEALSRRHKRIHQTGKREDAYCGAMDWCVENGLISVNVKASEPVTTLPKKFFDQTEDFSRRAVYAAYHSTI